MAFNLGNPAGSAAASGSVQSGSKLEDIQTERGLVAAAGPDTVIVATTESVRAAFEGTVSGDGNLKPFTPQLMLPMPMRISQVAFSADEAYLVLSAETGGGLAVYEIQSLLSGSTQSAFELATNGASLRALIPNPTPERAELFALITTDGNLMMANLKERNFINGPDGTVLKAGVSCVSWSARGKQLVAGLGNGAAYQMTPEGEGKAEIPRPPSIDAGDHVSSILWLENNVFLLVHTPPQTKGPNPPSSTFHLATRQPPSSFVFQQVSEPVGPYGLDRSPPHHFILRLRNFPPKLQDLLIVASTASTDIGLLSRSETPLTNDKPAEKISGAFTMTEMASDSRRAQLPLSAGLGDTSPIGLALDLSAKGKVANPIPGDEIDESPTPLPALMVLNNDGAVASWWIVYSDSIRQNTIYPGLTAAGVMQPNTKQSSAPASSSSLGLFATASKPAFGAPAFGAPNSNTAFGSSSLPGAAAGAFGTPSGLGKSQSPWGASTPSTTTVNSGPVFGSSTFGSNTTSSSTPAFGTTSTPAAFGLGLRSSPWATGGSTATNAAFGQAGGLGKPDSTFGSTPSNSGNGASMGSGFSAFANKGGFASAAAVTPGANGSIFGTKPAPSAFAPKSDPASMFGQQSTDTRPKGTFGSSGFVLGSTFKADDTPRDDEMSSGNKSAGSFFGGTFGNALEDRPSQTISNAALVEETAMSTDDISKESEISKADSTTPATTPVPPKTQMFSSSLTPTSLFGKSASSKPPASATFGLGQASLQQPSPKAGQTESSGQRPTPFSLSKTQTSVSETHFTDSQTRHVKQETPADFPQDLQKIPEAPLPPDITSKATYAAGESSTSSAEPDAPLPPDFIPKVAVKDAEAPVEPEEPERRSTHADSIASDDRLEGPEDNDESAFETDEEEGQANEESEAGSGEDVVQDRSPSTETYQASGLTPESSFSISKSRSADTSIFQKPSEFTHEVKNGALFGENHAPVLLLPRVQASPRSPSPVRHALPGRLQRPDTSRSVSAPGVASQLLGSRGASSHVIPAARSTFAISKEERDAEEHRRLVLRTQKEAEETRALLDQDDELLQAYLAAEIKPARRLDEFVAHSDYPGLASIDSIPAQVEAVYRDINSMIDTLGINAKALKSFVQGHEESRDEPRTAEDLEDDDDWCLVEVENLSVIVERELGRDLDQGQVKLVAGKLETCNDLQKDLIRLRAKHDDIRKILLSNRESPHVVQSRSQPLGAEQLAQQNDLRRDFTRFQKLLAEAEDGLSILKARVVSHATSSGSIGGASGPSVEAVLRTINKMTSMAEKRSGDVDVLEDQLRRLRFGSMTSTGSRETSPYATTHNTGATFRNTGSVNNHVLENIRDANEQLHSSWRSSTASYSRQSPGPRRKLSGYASGEKVQLRAKLAKKKEITNRLRSALQKAGTRVRLMSNDDD